MMVQGRSCSPLSANGEMAINRVARILQAQATVFEALQLLAGLRPIGDLLQAVIREQDGLIHSLEQYIRGAA